MDNIKFRKSTGKDLQVIELDDFVSSNISRFLNLKGLSTQFLIKDAKLWGKDEEYKSVESTVNRMKVVNDIAERGVALMDECNKLLTSNEDQKQFLLLIVKEYLRHLASDPTYILKLKCGFQDFPTPSPVENHLNLFFFLSILYYSNVPVLKKGWWA